MNEFQHEVKEALTSMMRQGKKSPSIWASSQPSRWNEKANPSKVVCQTLALSSMNLGCWNRKVHVAPDHSTAHAPLKYVWRSSACSYTNVMFRNCFFSLALLFFLFSCWLLPQHTILLSLRHCQHPCLPFMSYQQKPNEGKKRSIIINWCLMSHPENLLHSV